MTRFAKGHGKEREEARRRIRTFDGFGHGLELLFEGGERDDQRENSVLRGECGWI